MLLSAVIGLVFRLLGARGELWFDEIISLQNARLLSNPVEILTKLHFDNNHALNTLVMYFVDAGGLWPLYRAVSVVCSILLLMLLTFGRKESAGLEKFFSVLLFSFSYLLVLYGSEARGYAGMLFFVFCAYLLDQRLERDPRPSGLVLFWVVLTLGFLSQFTFLLFYFALISFAVYRWSKKFPPSQTLRRLLAFHAAPCAFFFWIYLIHLRYIPPGSGALHPYVDTIADFLSIAAGGPQISPHAPAQGLLGLSLALLLLAVAAIEILMLRREGDDKWFFYFMMLFAAPALYLALGRPRVLYERYFLTVLLFAYLLWGGFLERVYLKSAGGKVFCFACLAAFCLGNGMHISSLCQHGRGQYVKALEKIVEKSREGEIIIAGDHEVRNRTLIDFYAPALPGGDRLRYQANPRQVSEECPQWAIYHSQDYYERPPSLSGKTGEMCSYELAWVFESAPLSGWRWFVYKSG